MPNFVRLTTLALTFSGLASVALAGDAAELNILGFANDGKVFAFEEFGVQDGSGFPFANRFYIDVATDQFVAGTPIRARIDNEHATLDAARQEAAKAGQKIVKDNDLRPTFTAAANAITEISADPYKIVAQPRPVFPPIDKAIGLRLEEIELPTTQDCTLFGPTKGFLLIRFDPETNADIAVLHEDKRIPESRNCPLGYRLGGLETRVADGVMAVMISVRSAGFEGPNHRWLAVTGKL